jgi:hypothetical protein
MHSEYLVLIAFSRQQWLRERALVLCYTYTACLAQFKFSRLLTVTVRSATAFADTSGWWHGAVNLHGRG